MDKQEKISNLFRRVTPSYDLMNDLMSFGMHRRWKRHFVQNLPLFEGAHILDVAGGTGDIGRLILQQLPHVHLITLDLTWTMLQKAQETMWNQGLPTETFCQGDAQNLPLKDESIDFYTIAFGLRNVSDPLKALCEAYRVLKKGGFFYCLEFSSYTQFHIRRAYNYYSSLIPMIGKYIARDEDAYRYLIESIQAFLSPDDLKHHVIKAGFHDCFYEAYFSGIYYIHRAQKI